MAFRLEMPFLKDNESNAVNQQARLSYRRRLKRLPL
jgi:hypothetical protein